MGRKRAGGTAAGTGSARTATREDAERLARRLHARQRDRAGKPYVLHLERVAEKVAEFGFGETAVMVAWLHDAVEDGHTTAEALLDAGYGSDVVRAILTVTRDRDNETYANFIRRIAVSTNMDARVVKLADVIDHLEVTPESLTPGLRRRYLMALEQLGNA